MSDGRNMSYFRYINVSVSAKDTDAENMNGNLKLYKYCKRFFKKKTTVIQ